MPTFQSNIAARTGKVGNAGLEAPILYQGAVKYAQATVTLPSTLAANDILELATLPTGAQIIPSLSQAVCHADPGTALVLDIGNSADVDAYSDGLTLSSGGVVDFTVPAIPAQTTARTVLSEDTLVYATVMTATSITNNSVITFLIAYVVG